MLTDFQHSFTDKFSSKFLVKWYYNIPSHSSNASLHYSLRLWFSGAFRGLQIYDWTIRVRSDGPICPGKLCLPVWAWTNRHECKKGWTNQDAVYRADSCRLKEQCVVEWAHWRNLVNTIEPSAVPAKKQHHVQVWQRVHMYATVVVKYN